MNSKRIHISIAFGDAILPVIDCDDGHQRVPLKPIADQVGLDWRTQKRKILNDDYLTERLGVVMGEASLPQMAKLGLKKDQYLIRMDRVTAFLNMLNPRMIAALGNQQAADWLKDKLREWDDGLHAYETKGGGAKNSQHEGIKEIKALINAREKASAQEKRWLTWLIAAQASELGIPEQLLAGDQQQLPL